jgi:hypothetical protein
MMPSSFTRAYESASGQIEEKFGDMRRHLL